MILFSISPHQQAPWSAMISLHTSLSLSMRLSLPLSPSFKTQVDRRAKDGWADGWEWDVRMIDNSDANETWTLDDSYGVIWLGIST